MFIAFLRHRIHELQTFKMARFLWLKLIGISVYYRFFKIMQTYLNMATFKMPVLLLIKSWTFWYSLYSIHHYKL